MAVAFADELARLARPTDRAGRLALERHVARHWSDQAFFRRLNNMLFFAAPPDERWRVLAQFYRRDAALIGRFYRGRLTRLDRMRILSGRPPVPLGRGLKAFFERVAH
jgi:lycopene beta-cyclase